MSRRNMALRSRFYGTREIHVGSDENVELIKPTR
jgi:hypothetical protein